MNTNPDLETEADGAEYICAMAEKTGEHEKTVPRDASVLFPVREVPEIPVPPCRRRNMDGETVMILLSTSTVLSPRKRRGKSWNA